MRSERCGKLESEADNGIAEESQEVWACRLYIQLNALFWEGQATGLLLGGLYFGCHDLGQHRSSAGCLGVGGAFFFGGGGGERGAEDRGK